MTDAIGKATIEVRVTEIPKVRALLAERERFKLALDIYADPANWNCTEFGEYHEHSDKCCNDGWWNRSDKHGYSVAQSAIAGGEESPDVIGDALTCTMPVASFVGMMAQLRLARDLVAACEANGFYEELTKSFREAEKEG